MSILGQMKDPRRTTKGNLKHSLPDILFLVISAVLCGCNDWESIEVFGESQLEWYRKHYPYKNGIPSHDTLNRVFSALDPTVFSEKFIEWTQQICNMTNGELVAVDGKTIRRSYDKHHEKSAFHVVSAYASQNRLCLGQVFDQSKAGEITAIPQLLDLLFLKGSTVSIDAIGCQKSIVQNVLDKDADYLVAVKNNQRSLYEQIDTVFDHTSTSSKDEQIEVDHGRVETRTCSVIHDFTFLEEASNWPSVKSVVRVKNKRFTKSNSKTTEHVRYYISSRSDNAQQFNELIRAHWSIENNLHWMLDVVFQEDSSRRRQGNSAANFNIISKVALALIERIPHKKSKRQRRFLAGWDPKFRERVLNL
jgi:predicted transposase YbfD/YdcC